ncbi:MAG: hypothetical protein ACI31R_04415 [Bacilli bacterium]
MRKIIFDIVVVVYIIITIFVTACLLSYNDYGVSTFGDTSFIIADRDFVDLKKNDLIVVSKSSLDNIKKGDQVLYYKRNGKSAVVEVSKLKEVNKVTENESTYSLEDENRLSSDYVIGTLSSSKSFSILGNILNILESKWGYLLIIVFPIFLAFFYEIYAIMKELKSRKNA